MPLVMMERVKSRPARINIADPSQSTTTLLFWVAGTDNDILVRVFLENGALPITYAGMFCQGYDLDYLGGGLWDVQAHYSPIRLKLPGESTYSFDTTGGTLHITHGKETMRSYSWIDGKPAPDYQGAIGVNGESVEGCDIHLPVFTFSETHYIPRALVTGAYKLICFALTATTNAYPFKGLLEGEALFLGVKGSLRGYDYWEMSYHFAGSPNQDFVSVGKSDKIVAKKGWEYLWSRYADRVDGAAKTLVRVPVASYIERVYEASDFSLLGIGIV